MKKREAALVIFLIFILTITAVTILSAKKETKKSVQADTYSVNTNVNSNSDTNKNTNANSSNQTAVGNQNENSETVVEETKPIPEMPVLMYHHIRDFNDDNDKIGTNLSVSPDEFASQLDLIKQRGYTTVTFGDLEAGNLPDKPIILTFDDGYENFYQYAFPELKKRGMKAVAYIITGKIGTEEYMTSDQIKEIASNNIEIGSHTISHPDLSKASPEKAKNEIVESKQKLEVFVGRVISFCYPAGKFSSETEALVKEAGYNFAVTTKSGITKFDDRTELNRYRVNNDTDISSYIK